MWRAALAGVAVLCATAHADTRAWTIAEKVLPAGLEYVAAGRVVHARDAAKALQLGFLDDIHAICHFDPRHVLESIALGVRDDDRGVVVATLVGGADRASLETCLVALGKHYGKAVRSFDVGGITHYTGLTKELYVRWFGDRSFAIATDPENRDLLVAMTSGGLAKDAELLGAIRKANHQHEFWGAARVNQAVDELGATIATAYGTLDLANHQVAAEVHLVMDSGAAAAGAAVKATSALAEVDALHQVPLQFQGVVDSIVVVARGDELVVTAHAPTSILAALAKYAGE